MPSSLHRFLAAACLVLLSGGARAELPPGLAGGGLKGNEAYLDGSFFLTAPLRSTIGEEGTLEGALWLIEPYISWGEQGETAASLGLAWRHLFGEQTVSAMSESAGSAGFFEEGIFVGANLFLDSLDTQFDNRLWQAGGGLELGSRYLEVRTNYYLPMTDPQNVDTWVQDTNREQVSRRYYEPVAAGHAIEQEIGYGVYDIVTRTDRHLVGSEAGLEGWDAEAALLVPWIDRWMEVRVIPGYYRFQNQPFGAQTAGTGETEGWRLGTEVRPVPALALHATWYEDPAWTGQDWVAGFRAEVPFEIGDCGDGQGFWDRIHDGFRPRRRHLAERLIEPVKRQNTAVRTTSQVVEDVAARQVSQEVNTRREDRRDTKSLLHDVIYLNGGGATESGIGAGRADGDGTAQRPFSNASAAAKAAIQQTDRTGRIWTVYAEGSAAGADGDYNRQGYSFWEGGGRGFRLLGSGQLLQGRGGMSFGSGVAPWFEEIYVGALKTFEVSGVMAKEITCEAVESLWIHDNQIGTGFRNSAGRIRYTPGWGRVTPVAQYAGAIRVRDTAFAVIEDNDIWESDGPVSIGIAIRSIPIESDFAAVTTRAHIRNNVIRVTDAAIDVASYRSPGLTEVWITDNLIVDASTGVFGWDSLPPEYAPSPGTVRINALSGNILRNVGTELVTDFRNPDSSVRR